MICNTPVLFIGTDKEDVQILITDSDITDVELNAYDSIELHLIDDLGLIYAKYLSPFTSQDDPSVDGFHALRVLPDNVTLEFDIHKEDSINFRIGDLFVNIIYNRSDEQFTDGYTPLSNNNLISEVRR